MPPGEVRASSRRLTMTRSWRGRIFIVGTLFGLDTAHWIRYEHTTYHQLRRNSGCQVWMSEQRAAQAGVLALKLDRDGERGMAGVGNARLRTVRPHSPNSAAVAPLLAS